MSTISTVFLDRDGVINRLRPGYVTSWDAFAFLPNVKEALRLISNAGLRTIVVTNQRGVARGLMSPDDLAEIHARMLAEVTAVGGAIDAVYSCPHEIGACACRKPQVGLFLRAQQEIPEIDFARSVMVGDSVSDLIAGHQLGCRLALIAQQDRPGGELDALKAVRAAGISPDWVAPTLYDLTTCALLPSLAHFEAK